MCVCHGGGSTGQVKNSKLNSKALLICSNEETREWKHPPMKPDTGLTNPRLSSRLHLSVAVAKPKKKTALEWALPTLYFPRCLMVISISTILLGCSCYFIIMMESQCIRSFLAMLFSTSSEGLHGNICSVN